MAAIKKTVNVGDKKKAGLNEICSDFSEAYKVSVNSYFEQISNDKRLKLIDLFCLFLVFIGVLQFLFVVLIKDNFPFNAFLAGFIICVGQFVLLICLRLQLVNPCETISKNRAFGEFIMASLILHFICIHFIN